MKTLFVSDLHLDAASPEIARQFHAFLEDSARSAEALYILGDLFEAWLGDDDPDPAARATVRALRALTDLGVPVFVMHGNRYFLIGERFCRGTRATLLADEQYRRLQRQAGEVAFQRKHGRPAADLGELQRAFMSRSISTVDPTRYLDGEAIRRVLYPGPTG